MFTPLESCPLRISREWVAAVIPLKARISTPLLSSKVPTTGEVRVLFVRTSVVSFRTTVPVAFGRETVLFDEVGVVAFNMVSYAPPSNTILSESKERVEVVLTESPRKRKTL